MNESGKAVKSIIAYLSLITDNLWVIHDDIDLPLGKIKITKNRGAAGHKGVQSIINELKTKNFIRFRIGVQPKQGKPKNMEKFALQNFNKTEEKIIKQTINKTCDAIETAIKQGTEKAMTEFN
jgi:PTH1 family peptidyl-tRNA hydrolase